MFAAGGHTLASPWHLTTIVGSLRDREVACSASDRQGANFESCVWRTVSSQTSHHPQEVLLAQFSLYVHNGGLKPDSFHFFDTSQQYNIEVILQLWDVKCQQVVHVSWRPRASPRLLSVVSLTRVTTGIHLAGSPGAWGIPAVMRGGGGVDSPNRAKSELETERYKLRPLKNVGLSFSRSYVRYRLD